ncbi:hydroxyacylglutathione hydrolase [Nitrosomonas sp. Nm51]|uniref:hydroxyacylglutathione hydrolase n=1 Tax=Nitrosomonas sp. Nm51 TaxID=133720 RepID=UPI0008B23BC4|nr:hydroxyacylglutathione hydrolase [Nitrosomonas sp. Nm51]SER63006.1 hydroxyacylglutathione hydrolase [Nitrosomonas sp. Nm51]
MTTLRIYPIPAFRDNYIWIIHNTASAVAVDPGDALPVLNYLQTNKLQLDAILITHHHNDHTGGNRTLLERFDVPVYGPGQEAIPTVTHPLQDGDTVSLPSLSLTLAIIDVPGHTSGHIAYFGSLPGAEKKNVLFCGDTLFACGCGRLFEGTPQQMYQSLQKLADLPEDTLVYCTHEYTLSNIGFARTVEPSNSDLQQFEQHAKQLRDHNQPTIPTNIAAEKMCNPFLRCNQPEIIKTVSQYAGKKLNEPLDIFITLREWKNNF